MAQTQSKADNQSPLLKLLLWQRSGGSAGLVLGAAVFTGSHERFVGFS